MKELEFSFLSVNGNSPGQKIVSTACIPENLSEKTGIMLFCHGWGNPRNQNFDKMKYSCDAFDLLCVAPEYRMSGYAFDPEKGAGWSQPYDLSFMQTFDCLNALRFLLDLYPFLDRKRIFVYGGSQGGHIALLSSIFAPSTFAFLYASCPLTHIPEEGEVLDGYAGRDFSEAEKSVRNVPEHCSSIRCPVYLDAGTMDEAVSFSLHAEKLEKILKKENKQITSIWYEGGRHDLSPVTNRLEAYKKMMPEVLKNARNTQKDDFLAGNIVKIKCADKILIIDWSKGTADKDLFHWEKAEEE